jgi:chromosome segregation ATPase
MWNLTNLLNDLDGAVKDVVESVQDEGKIGRPSATEIRQQRQHSPFENEYDREDRSATENTKNGGGSGRVSPFDGEGMRLEEPKGTKTKTKTKVMVKKLSSNKNAPREKSQTIIPVPVRASATASDGAKSGAGTGVGSGALQAPQVPSLQEYPTMPQVPSQTSTKDGTHDNKKRTNQTTTKFEPITSSSFRPPAAISTNTSASYSNTVIEKELEVAKAARVEAEIALDAKEEEIERLNGECLALEDEVSGLKKEVESAWKTYKTAQETAASRQTELVDTISSLEKNMASADDDFEGFRSRLVAAENAKEAAEDEIRAAESKVSHLEDRIKSLEAELQITQRGNMQGIQSIQEQLRSKELGTDNLRQEYADWKRKSEERQASLEQSNAELLASLANRDREVRTLKDCLSSKDGCDTTNIGVTRELDGLRQQYDDLLALMESETMKNSGLETKLAELENTTKANKLILQDERSRNIETSNYQTSRIADLEQKLKDAEKSLITSSNKKEGSDAIRDLENQVQSLGSQLLKKQSTVQELVAERSGLKAKIDSLQTRCSNAELELSKLKDLEGEDDLYMDNDDDGSSQSLVFKAASPYIGAANFSSNALSKESGTPSKERRPRHQVSHKSGKISAEFEKLGVKRGSVVKAIEGVDSWALMSGRFLRSYPLLRLGFVLYLLMLHFWVFLVLSFHMTSLDEEAIQDPLNVHDAGIADPTNVHP